MSFPVLKGFSHEIGGDNKKFDFIKHSTRKYVNIWKICELSEESAQLLKDAFEAMGLTARSYDRILKVARTVADLDGCEEIEPQHIAEAIQYRAVNLGNR